MALGAPLDAPSLFLSYIVNTARAALEQIEATGAALPADEDRDLALHSLDYALKLPDAWSVTGSLLTALAPKMERAGYRHDWIAYLDAGIDASQQCGDQATEAELRLQKGILHQLLAEYHEADGEYLLSEAGFAALPDQRALARVLNRRAFVARRQGRHEDAERLAAAAMALLAADDAELGYTYQVLGTIAYDRMQWQEAARCFRLSLDLLRQGDDRRLQGWAHSNLGLALWQTGDLVGAEAQLLQAIDLFALIGDPIHQSVARLNLGNVLVARGELEQALLVYAEAEAVFRKAHDIERLASVNNNIGKVCRDLGRPAEALPFCRQAVSYYQQTRQPAELVIASESLGETLLALEDWSGAAETFLTALDRLPTVENEDWRAETAERINGYLQQIDQQAGTLSSAD
ncbi:MAG: tetratricopeptide repeat protein [Anaerolineales bacterium]|nr:tetratricopeptide repeat protein [Anaerolineales bacterium]